MRLARKSLSFAAVALISVGLMSPVAQAQAERVVAFHPTHWSGHITT